MQIIPHLNFNGQCAEAFKFYQQHLGAKTTFMMTFGESPMAADMPPEWHSKIIHASIVCGESHLMGSDAPPGRYVKPDGITISIDLKSTAEAERIFKSLSENGSVQMPLAQTFWAERFGMLTDQFGIPWMINCSKPA